MPDVIGSHFVKTRKPHVCFGCGRRFPENTRMEKSFVTDGKPFSCYLCETCYSITQTMRWDDEFGYGDLRDEALEREAQEKQS